MKISSSSLLTGIPRSGTTLCCKILNSTQRVVALHEPLTPGQIGKSEQIKVVSKEIKRNIEQIIEDLNVGDAITLGDSMGLAAENPVGEKFKDGRRQMIAKRGLVKIETISDNPVQLVIKQNALFTAALPDLLKFYPITGIVRNPIDVFCSWMTVDLPVSYGFLPAGERFNQLLKEELEREKNVLKRQLIIYEWFFNRFKENRINILRYEDIIESNGQVLLNSLGVCSQSPEILELKPIKRKFSQHTLNQLEYILPSLTGLDLSPYYTQEDILVAFNRLIK